MKNPILIVDDEDDICTTWQEIFTLSGYSAIKASNGEQALALLQSGVNPSVILLDLTMPLMNGVDLLQHLQATPEGSFAQIPVVIVSAVVADIPSLDAYANVDRIQKPAPLEQLLALAERYCGRA